MPLPPRPHALRPGSPPGGDGSGAGVAGAVAPGGLVRLSEVLSALSVALDLTEGERSGHAARTCLIGMRLAETVGLPLPERSALYYALLLKDAGCSSNAARMTALFAADDRRLKPATKVADWPRLCAQVRYALEHAAPGQPMGKRTLLFLALSVAGRRVARQLVHVRCERGADIVRKLGLPRATAEAIRSLDEHWDGGGYPDGLRGESIPLLARICGLSQTLDAFLARFGPVAAIEMARARSGRWFDPELVRALGALEGDADWWEEVATGRAELLVHALEPEDHVLRADDAGLDLLSEVFADIIDAKSAFTYRHSRGVAQASLAVAGALGFDRARLRDLRRAALLHDIGKLGVSNLILDKPGPLTPDEFAQVRRHPAFTADILGRVAAFRPWAPAAAAHHERLDGKGYHLGVPSGDLPVEARVLMVADVFDALSADRPYRAALPRERVLEIMRGDVGSALCPTCFAAFAAVQDDLPSPQGVGGERGEACAAQPG